jgi:hypothetical protein
VLYTGLTTDPGLYCFCVAQFDAWLLTTAPPTRTLSITFPAGVVTETIVDGEVVTTSFQTDSVFTTVTARNEVDAGEFEWFGTAQSPCVSCLHPGR